MFYLCTCLRWCSPPCEACACQKQCTRMLTKSRVQDGVLGCHMAPLRFLDLSMGMPREATASAHVIVHCAGEQFKMSTRVPAVFDPMELCSELKQQMAGIVSVGASMVSFADFVWNVDFATQKWFVSPDARASKLILSLNCSTARPIQKLRAQFGPRPVFGRRSRSRSARRLIRGA